MFIALLGLMSVLIGRWVALGSISATISDVSMHGEPLDVPGDTDESEYASAVAATVFRKKVFLEAPPTQSKVVWSPPPSPPPTASPTALPPTASPAALATAAPTATATAAAAAAAAAPEG